GALRNTDRRSRAGAGGPRQAHRGRCLFAAGSIGDRRVAGPRQRVADGRPCRARPVRNARAARSAALWKRGRIVHRCVDAAGCITLRRRALARRDRRACPPRMARLAGSSPGGRRAGGTLPTLERHRGMALDGGGRHARRRAGHEPHGGGDGVVASAPVARRVRPACAEHRPARQGSFEFQHHGPGRGQPQGARLNWASGAEPIEDLTGSLAFDGGRLQGSTLTGTWLGGPVTLRLDERPDHGQTALVMQARGSMAAQQLAALAAIDPRGRLAGSAEWAGDLTFSPATAAQPARWRVRADSTLVGVGSELPEPLEKGTDGSLPLHLELSGTDSVAQLRVSLADRLRSVLALERAATGWKVERGAVTFGSGVPALPAEPVVLIQGRVSRLDLPSYLALWQQARLDPRAPHFQAQLVATEMVAAGRTF